MYTLQLVYNRQDELIVIINSGTRFPCPLLAVSLFVCTLLHYTIHVSDALIKKIVCTLVMPLDLQCGTQVIVHAQWLTEMVVKVTSSSYTLYLPHLHHVNARDNGYRSSHRTCSATLVVLHIHS